MKSLPCSFPGASTHLKTPAPFWMRFSGLTQSADLRPMSVPSTPVGPKHPTPTNPSSPPACLEPEKSLHETKMEKKVGPSLALALVPPCGVYLCDCHGLLRNGCGSPEGTVSIGASGELLTHKQNCLSHSFHIVNSESSA